MKICMALVSPSYELASTTWKLTVNVGNCGAGLLDRDKRGVWVYFRARPEAIAALGTLFDSALTPVPA